MYSSQAIYLSANTTYVATGSFNVSWGYSPGKYKSQQQMYLEEEAKQKRNKAVREMKCIARKQQMPNLPIF